MKKKYELTDQTINVDGRTLHRIKALRDFSDVQAGELGGWIEKEENLSHAGKAWVYCEACVFDNAKVSDCAKISGYAKVFCNACVYGSAEVRCYAKVYDDAEVYDRAWVSGRTKIFGRSQVYGRAKVSESAQIDEDVKILNWAEVYGNAQVFGHTLVCGRAKVYGYVRLCCDCFIGGDAEVCDKSDYIVFKNFWSSGRYFVWTGSNNRWRVGCFYGTGEELIKHAYADSEKSGREYERAVRYVESILADEEKEKE